MAEISSESQFFSGNIANMIPDWGSPEQNGTTHGGWIMGRHGDSR